RLRLRQLADRVDELWRELAGAPDAASIAGALAELGRREQAAARAAHELTAARAAADSADRELSVLATAAGRAHAALARARDPLVGLGAPSLVEGHGSGEGPTDGLGAAVGPPAGVDLAASWAALVSWAGELAARRSTELDAATARDTDARGALTAATRAHARAGSAAERAARDHGDALHEERTAASRLETLVNRVAELHAALAGLPSAAEVTATLAELDRLAETARAADQRLRAARADADTAAAALADARQELRTASSALAGTRDTVVALDAPPLGGHDLLADWTALTSWAGAEAAERDGRLTVLGAAAADAQRARDEAVSRLGELLAAHGIAASDAAPAARAASTALERARSRLDRIRERRAEGAKIAAELGRAREAEQVAHQLGVLLRSDRFQRWLVAAALDLLVEDASRTLAELSNGQFELTHDDGDFIVVDHADADSRRPVRTLSGGETFQASLALALALSAQLTTMSAAGAARLDSIFLDEGFGTLDDATLDTVASTLENLAGGDGAGGGRMVGIVTHVRALAERVPVRFAVSRDQRTSTVIRETP